MFPQTQRWSSARRRRSRPVSEQRLEEIHRAAAFETSRKIGWTRRPRRFDDLDGDPFRATVIQSPEISRTAGLASRDKLEK